MKDQRFLIRILWGTAVIYQLLLILFLLLNLGGNIPLYIFIYFELFLLFFLGWYLIRKYKPYPAAERPFESRLSKFFYGEKGQFYLIKIPFLIIATGVVFRLTLIPAHPATSEDAFRYLWEGKMNLYGFNPYLLPPDDPQLVDIYEDDLPSKANFQHLTSIYPPLSQYLFSAGYLLSGDSTAGLKIVFLLCEIITLVFLLKLIILRNLHPGLIILYAWLPLPVMEYFVNAHIDAAGIMFMVLFIYFLIKNKVAASGLFFAFAVLIKLMPLMFLPLILKQTGIKKFILFAGILVFTSVLFYLPFIGEGLSIFDHLIKYLERWEFNGSVYQILKLFLYGEQARIICTILFTAAFIIIFLKQRDFIKGIFYVLMAYFIFTSTLYPWYLGWGAALNPLFNFYSLMSLFFTINLSNFTPLADVWKEYTIVLLLEYIPFFLLLIIDILRERSDAEKSKAGS